MFVTFEGGEGCGKTTQSRLLAEWLREKGHNVTLTREPGGDAGSESIRNLLLTGASDKWHPVAETLLFQAARVQHIASVIRPALDAGHIVLCDRFLDSTLVYQGYGKGQGQAFIRRLHGLTLGDLLPDHTYLLDVPPAIGLARAAARQDAQTRFEDMPVAFHQSVREGFLALAAQAAPRYSILDACQLLEVIQQTIRQDFTSRHLPV